MFSSRKPVTSILEYIDNYRFVRDKSYYNRILFKKRWLPRYYTDRLYNTNYFLKCTTNYICNIQISPTYFFFYKLRRMDRIHRLKRKWNKYFYTRKKFFLFSRIKTLNYLHNLPVGAVLSKQQRVLLGYLKISKCLPKISKNISYYYNYIHNLSVQKRKIGIWIFLRQFGLFIKRRFLNLHFYYLSKIKKYTDCFYVVNKFIYWYSYFNTNRFRTLLLQSIKYNKYKNWYNKNFLYNYNNVISVLKTYNFKGSYSSKLFLKSSTFKNSFFKYLTRKQHLFSYNFWYRIVTKKKSVTMYNKKLLKKLTHIHSLRLTSIKTHAHNSYTYDISTLFYNKLKNRRYIETLDEKYYLYMKEIMLTKSRNVTKTNTVTKISKHKNVKGIFPLFLPKNNYYNLYFFFNINKTFISNRLITYFSNINIYKCQIFILKSNNYYFFKDYTTYLYKMLVYSKSLKVKKYFLKYVKPTGFLRLWFILIRSYKVGALAKKRKLIATVETNIKKHFKINRIDWYNMLSKKILNKKKDIFKQYKRTYKSLYRRFVPRAKKNVYLNYLLKPHFNENKVKFINLVKENLLRRNKFFNTKWSNTSRDLFTVSYTYFCYLKIVNKRRKIRRIFVKPRFFKKKQKKTDSSIKINDQLSNYCNKLLLKGSDNGYNTNKYFQYFNKVEKDNIKLYDRSNLKNVWSVYIKNYNISLYVTKQIIIYIYLLIKYKRKNTSFFKKRLSSHLNTEKISTLFKNIQLLTFFESKEDYFTDVLSPRKIVANYKKKKKEQKNSDMYTIQSKVYNYMSNIQRSLFFTTSVFKNKYKYIFMCLKSMLINNYVTDIFATYKNHILIYKLVANKLLIANLSGTVPKLLNVLDMSISDVILK